MGGGRVVAQEEVNLSLPHERGARLGSQVGVLAGPRGKQFHRSVGLTGEAEQVDELRLDDHRAHIAAIGFLELADGQPGCPLIASGDGLLDRTRLALDLQVHQVVFHLLDPLIELFKLLPVLRFRLRGRKVARLDLVEDNLEPVAGQVDRSCPEKELEQFHVQATGALGVPRGSWAAAWSRSHS